MNSVFTFSRKPLCDVLFSAGILLCAGGVHSDPRFTVPADLAPGTRLADWLVSQGVYRSPGFLAWQVPGEFAAQAAQKRRLIEAFSSLDLPGGKTPTWQGLRARIAAMPVTGRVRLPSHDPRLLQARPGIDPVLVPGQQVAVGAVASVVTLLREDGELCQLPHWPGAETRDYLRACGRADTVDEAWIVQADGQVTAVSVADWNAARQDEPAPGAWLWAPERNAGVSRELSFALAKFLATQVSTAEDSDSSVEPSGKIFAAETARKARDLPLSASDWGSIGLLQTPTARFGEAGRVSATVSKVDPYTRYGAMFQPFDWLEAGFLYNDIGNRLYGPSIAGSQSFKDKQVDVKVRLMRESAFLPELAVGARDIGGTGLFSGEYVVANKRFGDFDLSLGLGWGYVGGRGNFRNPLSNLSSRFETRPPPKVGEGGEFSVGTYFRGPTALFGGVQYHTAWPRWVVKAELDGNNYAHEPLNNPQSQSSPFNFGLAYLGDWVEFSAGFERGNTAMFRLTLHGRVDQLRVPKFTATPIPVEVKDLPVSAAHPAANSTKVKATPSGALAAPAPPLPATSRFQENTLQDLTGQSGWYARRIRQSGDRWEVDFDESEGLYLNDRIDRAVSVLHRDAPLAIREFQLRFLNKDVEVSLVRIDRREWMLAQTRLLPPNERRTDRQIVQPAGLPPELLALKSEQKEWGDQLERAPSRFDGNLGFGYQQTLGGPDGFLLYSISGQANASARLWSGAWLAGSLSIPVVNNYDQYQYLAPSKLPRVRTYIGEYVRAGGVTMPYLQFTQMGRAGSEHFFSFYGGMLEMMYGGVGAEWLYRPTGSRIAVGADVNAVRQRRFEQDFSFRDYRVNTGHITAYWDTGWQDLLAKISVGRYLAGDTGATVDLSRVFGNGVKIGAFAAKTNVSAEQYGEGSFNKGIYLSIPFDAMFTRDLGGKANVLWTPLTRDGGQMLNRQFTLYDMTSLRDARALQFAPPPVPGTLPDKLPAGAESDVGTVDVLPVTQGLVEQLEALSLADTRAFPPQEKAAEYRLGASDVVRILVWGHPELSGQHPTETATDLPSGPLNNQVQGRSIDRDGNIVLPLVGKVAAAGLTVPELRERLTRAISEYVPEPQVELDVLAYRSQWVVVNGSVQESGLLPISDVPLRLTDAVLLSGGVTAEAAVESLTLLRDGRKLDIDFQRIVERGDQRQNLLLRHGDQITVPDRLGRKVFVMGEVMQPRAQLMRRGRMTLTEVLADAGGPNPFTANVGEVFVMRQGGDGRPKLYQLDARQPAALVLAERFTMMPRDLVFVNSTGVVRVARTIAQLFPVFQGIQASVTIK